MQEPADRADHDAIARLVLHHRLSCCPRTIAAGTDLVAIGVPDPHEGIGAICVFEHK